MMRKYIIAFMIVLLSTGAQAATKRIYEYTALTTPVANDYLLLSDSSDSDREKKVALSELFDEAVSGAVDGYFANIHTDDYVYFLSDDLTHYVAVAAGNNIANLSIKWPTTLPAAGTTRLANFDEDGNMGLVDPANFLTPTGVGSSLTLTASGFNGNLATTDDTIQEVAQKLDDLNITGAAHDAVTLGTDADVLLGLSTQQLTLDSQTANYFFAAPNGSAGDPTFRAIADADIPSAIARDSELPSAASDTAYDATTWDGVTTVPPSKNAIRDHLESKLPSGSDGQYGVWLTDNTVNPTTYSTGKWGYSVYNNAPVWCYNGTCTSFMSNPMTTAGDMIKGGTSGAAARMVPGTGVVTLLETPTSANFFSAITGETGSGAVVGGTAPGFTTSANPATADGATLGTTALEWSDIYLAAGGVIYGENDQSNNLTSSSTGWAASLDFTITGSDLILGAAGVQLTGDGDGAVTLLGRGDGSDEDMTINLDDTANVIGVSSSTGVTAMRLDMALQAPIVFNSYTSAQTLTAAAHNSTLVQMTTADEVTLWDCETANVGQHVVLWARDAEKIEVVPASGDQFYLFSGTGIGANDELDMVATAGTKVTLMCTADDSWSVVYETAACTDGGAAD